MTEQMLDGGDETRRTVLGIYARNQQAAVFVEGSCLGRIAESFSHENNSFCTSHGHPRCCQLGGWMRHL